MRVNGPVRRLRRVRMQRAGIAVREGLPPRPPSLLRWPDDCETGASRSVNCTPCIPRMWRSQGRRVRLEAGRVTVHCCCCSRMMAFVVQHAGTRKALAPRAPRAPRVLRGFPRLRVIADSALQRDMRTSRHDFAKDFGPYGCACLISGPSSCPADVQCSHLAGACLAGSGTSYRRRWRLKPVDRTCGMDLHRELNCVALPGDVRCAASRCGVRGLADLALWVEQSGAVLTSLQVLNSVRDRTEIHSVSGAPRFLCSLPIILRSLHSQTCLPLAGSVWACQSASRLPTVSYSPCIDLGHFDVIPVCAVAAETWLDACCHHRRNCHHCRKAHKSSGSTFS